MTIKSLVGLKQARVMKKQLFSNNNSFFSFNEYLKDKFGQRVQKISVNAGFSCPNIEGTLGTEGCIFCNNDSFSYFKDSRGISLEEQISKSIEYSIKRFKAKKFIIYFQNFSNTFASAELLREKYSVIRQWDSIVGIAISTRPDCIDEDKLDVIEDFARDYEVYIEYGLQTIHDKTLRIINRNHSFADFHKAVKLTSRRNINIGVHVILGLIGETKEDMLLTAKTLASMPLWGVKFHCMHVVKNTFLEKMYAKGEVVLLSKDEYIDILVSFIERIPRSHVILRLVSDADKDLLVAPTWVNQKQTVLKEIEKEFIRRNTYQGRLHEGACY